MGYDLIVDVESFPGPGPGIERGLSTKLWARILEITVRLCLCSRKPSTLPHPHGRRADELSNINVHGAPDRPVPD